jgi:hypothetical protein
VVFVKRQRPASLFPAMSSPAIISTNSSSIPTLHFECFVCGTALHTLDDSSKDLHLNICLDKLETPQAVTFPSKNSEGIRSENYGCLLCGLSLSGKPLIIRCQHLKRCSKIHGIGIRELLQMISPEKFEEVLSQMENIDTDVATGTAERRLEASKPNAHDILMANAKVKWNQGIQPSATSSSNFNSRQPSHSHSRNVRSGNSNQDPKRRREERDDSTPRGDYAPEYKKVLVPPMTTPIIVDGFSFASATLSDCYFLTHFHSDHYSGLTRAFEYGSCFHPPCLLSLS